ncbi:pyridoxal phosphate-dependent transferase [Phaeosphaeriaceae sp. PMI808]|nr:pyridoxal phosphate-dependent transferase [Phaeosphaeriaceae sp. PMI808]
MGETNMRNNEGGEQGMSKRGFSNVEAIMPRIDAQVAERTKTKNFNIDLSTAENCLIREEVIDIYKKAIQEGLNSSHLSYPKGFSGDPSLLFVLAKFLNTYFHPAVPVMPQHIVTAPGAATCLDSLLYNICDPGDGVLVPGPYWNGFDFQFQVRDTVEPITVNLDNFADTFTKALIPALTQALKNSTRPVRALVLTNPHNPFGQMYSKEVLEACVEFCQRYNIHYISDEVYALSTLPKSGVEYTVPFVSALSLDLEALGCDTSRVHTIWSTSKDFGSSGIRMGCIVTQSNALGVGAALAANTQTSSLSAIATEGLLGSPCLPLLLKLNRERLAVAYKKITDFFVSCGIEFIPVTAGIYVFARLAPEAKTWEDEATMIARIKGAGVLVSGGKAYHVVEKEKGWVRITFAVAPEDLEKAIEAMKCVYLGKTEIMEVLKDCVGNA